MTSRHIHRPTDHATCVATDRTFCRALKCGLITLLNRIAIRSVRCDPLSPMFTDLCVLDTLVNPAKTVEVPIEVSFGAGV